ncbi:MAG TPA: ABC transporter transmembrane domain-containing protein, partial [Caulobacteraceae bacterium]|nr:ABC transporter transmembrane domain-containing protein [Caulobacteraceae bacterium]
MSDFIMDRDMGGGPPPEPRKRNANLGTADGEEIFMSFDTRIVRRFSAFLKPHPWSLIGALVAAIVSSGASVLIPVMIGQVVTAATSGANRLHRVDMVIIGLILVVVLFTITSLVSQWLSTKLAQKVIFDVRRAMFEHFQTIALSFMDKTHV